MRRFSAVLLVVALLLVPVAAFADDPILQPPIGSHTVTQPADPLGFWDVLLIVWSEL